MYVKIGNYKSWFGPYQLADLLQKVGVSEDKCYKIGELLSNTFIYTILQKIEDKRKRKIKVQIDKYDTWSMDHTLALIIYPMLKQLKETKHGAPSVDEEDVPLELHSINASKLTEEEKNSGTADSLFFKRWDYVLDQMIWSFSQIIKDDLESQFHTGVTDINSVPLDKKGNIVSKELAEFFELKKGIKDTSHFDKEGYDKHYNKVKNGLKLFGKYYMNLWD